ncbi:MAG: nucleotide exchange factor GrpE [Bacteroidales bacterium]|jgi:molecular chaperone GrpE|nr:nucleotide exchange factor GrpE [Bacteroidales bacterium]MEE0937345.1 nucleotide exchange factor GrpE [Bacteroidales bacterium]MEE0961853.1 nucleotide exchange factor GrpE [Bacteroidales bacterium]MEE0992663.1 nucleotide exchange factor GrpE [Bacteroidales bacterium]MEE1001822.1 nucleotide exchange factor GrpE [Bacteroidales bacterium]
MKKEKNKAENIINKLLKKNKNMAENKEEKEELTDKTEQSEQETQNEETPKAEQEEAKEDDLATKLEELNKKYLLLYSDFENFRKRKAKEQMELVMNASEGLIKELLPVIDDYERALQNMESQDNEVFAKTKEGMELIYNKLIGTLTKKGLKPINAKGEMFDENLHEAIARIPAQNEDEKGKVIDETTKGYYLNDKVIRYSKVVVAM